MKHRTIQGGMRDSMSEYGDEFEEEGVDVYEEEVVLNNATQCQVCDEMTEHEVLREKKVGDGKDLLLRCSICEEVSNLEIRPPKLIRIPFILTEGPESLKITIDIDSDEVFYLGDVFEENDKLWTINQILVDVESKVKLAHAGDVLRISALRTDMVRVKLTITSGEQSDSDTIVVQYGKSFTGGNLMDHNGETWRIRAIHTGEGRTMKGTVKAQDIKRIYLHEPPQLDHFEPKTPRERRQAWKEGRLGYNPEPITPKEVTKKRVTPTNKRKIKRPRN